MPDPSIIERIRMRLAAAIYPSRVPTPFTYASDGLTTMHNADFLRHPAFREAYALGVATNSWRGAQIEWRAYVVCWAASKGRTIEGDYVECGVARGGFSRAAMHYIGFEKLPQKKFYLVDTFRGIPAKYVEGTEVAELNRHYTDSYDDVLRTFAPFPNAVIVRGEIPEILSGVVPEKVCYLSIDLNCTEPSIAAAEHFWPRMSAGAVIVLDDYGFSPFLSLKHAADDFAQRHGVEVLSLPTGQGLIFKP